MVGFVINANLTNDYHNMIVSDNQSKDYMLE